MNRRDQAKFRQRQLREERVDKRFEDDTEMSDSELWARFKLSRQNKREDNVESSTQLLVDNNIAFTSYNFGIHLAIKRVTCIVDFWPSTGKWIVRGQKGFKRGVHKLLKFLESHEAISPITKDSPLTSNIPQSKSDKLPWED